MPPEERKIQLVPEEILRAMAAEADVSGPTHASSTNGTFNLDDWMARHFPDADGPSPWNGGRKWILPTCPWDPTHINRAAHVLHLASGAIAAGCLHDSCRGKRWHDLRDVVEPGWRESRRRDGHAAAPLLEGSGGGAAAPKVELPEPYEQFPLEVLPPSVRQFAEGGAAAMGCDPAYVALPTLAALAAAIGNTRRIRLKRGWSEPSILWATCVGESGTLKSPALDLALRAVRDVQEAKLREYAKVLEEHEIARLQYEKELSAWKRSKDDSDPPEKPQTPTAERLTISDITIEACACLLENAPRGLLLARDELSSWVGSFDAFKQGKSDAGHWCELHRGGTLLVDRKSGERRTIYVPRASVSLTGGIQPRIMRHALGDEHRENGLLARLLVAMPPRKARRWTDAEIDPELTLRMRGVFERLWGIVLEKDPEGEPLPRALPVTPEGKQIFVEFVNEHGEEQVELEGDLASAWSKLEGYAARLSLVLHLVRWAEGDSSVNPEAVDEVSVEAGVTLARWFCREARRVYAVLLEDEPAQLLRQILERIQRLGGAATAYDLHRSSRKRFPKSEDAEQALQDLVQRGMGRWEPVPPGSEGGRPTRRFVLNPRVETPSNCEGNEGLGFSPQTSNPEGGPDEEEEWTA